jgi:hypothetical protein
MSAIHATTRRGPGAAHRLHRVAIGGILCIHANGGDE